MANRSVLENVLIDLEPSESASKKFFVSSKKLQKKMRPLKALRNFFMIFGNALHHTSDSY